MSIPHVLLGEVATFIRGVTFKPTDVMPGFGNDSVDCMRTKNVQNALDRSDVWAIPRTLVKRGDQYLEEGDLLISSANSWNLVGKCCWIPKLERPTTFGGFVTVLRANRTVLDCRYLYHWFSSDKTQATLRSYGQKTTNISNLNINRCREASIPLPPLDEQRRIAAILDQAEELRAKRLAAIALLDQLPEAIFLEMFGDPVSNPMGWSMRALGELLDSIDSGWSPQCLDRPKKAAEWGVLKLGAVTWGKFRPEENKALPPGVHPRASIEVRRGDLLFVRKNTYNLVAACAHVLDTPKKLMMSDLIFRLGLKPEYARSVAFFHQLLMYPAKRKQIQRLAGGSSGSMPNISKAKLAQVAIPLPPIDELHQFASRVDAIHFATAQHESALNELDALFTSLQARIFSTNIKSPRELNNV